MLYLAYKCKAEVVSKFHLFKNSSIVNFPICCSAEEVPLETTQHTQYTHWKYQERATSQVVSHKCSQASIWHDTIKSKAIHITFMPWSGGKTSFWYHRRMKKRKTKLGICFWIVHCSQSELHHDFMTNVTTHLWISTAFTITGNIRDSPAKSRSSYQQSSSSL